MSVEKIKLNKEYTDLKNEFEDFKTNKVKVDEIELLKEHIKDLKNIINLSTIDLIKEQNKFKWLKKLFNV